MSKVKVTETADVPGRAADVEVSFGINKLKGIERTPAVGDDGWAMIAEKSGHLYKNSNYI
jgi:hypothetical protein